MRSAKSPTKKPAAKTSSDPRSSEQTTAATKSKEAKSSKIKSPGTKPSDAKASNDSSSGSAAKKSGKPSDKTSSIKEFFGKMTATNQPKMPPMSRSRRRASRHRLRSLNPAK